VIEGVQRSNLGGSKRGEPNRGGQLRVDVGRRAWPSQHEAKPLAEVRRDEVVEGVVRRREERHGFGEEVPYRKGPCCSCAGRVERPDRDDARMDVVPDVITDLVGDPAVEPEDLIVNRPRSVLCTGLHSIRSIGSLGSRGTHAMWSSGWSAPGSTSMGLSALESNATSDARSSVLGTGSGRVPDASGNQLPFRPAQLQLGHANSKLL
jgi:hypothetical protein